MLLNGVLAMNPIVWIVAAIILGLTLLYLGLKWLYDNVTWFRDGVNGAWDFIKQHWVTILSYLGAFLLGGPIGMALLWLYNNVGWFRDAVNAIWNFIKQHWITVIGAIAGFILGGPLGGAIGFFIGLLVECYQKNETFRNIVNGVWNTVKTVVGNAISEMIGKISGLIAAAREAGAAMKSLLNGDISGALDHAGKVVSSYKNAVDTQRMKHKMGNKIPTYGTMATGTDYFPGWRYNNMTTTDEHGDEAIWLPNGSMIARNTTTRDMLGNLKSIKKNTRGGTKETGAVVTNNNHFVFNVNGTDETLQELKRELEKLGIV